MKQQCYLKPTDKLNVYTYINKGKTYPYSNKRQNTRLGKKKCDMLFEEGYLNASLSGKVYNQESKS